MENNMHTRKRIHHIAVVLLVALSTGIASPFANAADFSSPSFLIRDPSPEEIGGTSTSTTFESLMSGSDIAQTEASSTNFVMNTGPMFFESFTPASQKWRWYDDELSETPTVSLEAEDVAPTNVQTLAPVKLRMTIAETSAYAAAGVKMRLQYATSSSFSDGGNFVVERGDCTLTSEWCYADGVDTDNDIITTSVLSDPDSCVASAGNGCGTHNESGTTTSTFIHKASAKTEYEFTIQDSGASPNTVYFFRAYYVSAVPLNTGESYPSLSTSGGTLTFTIEGLATSTATGGVTTDIATSPTSVPFGALLLNTAVIAAHRLTVTTNAAQGYKIYMYQEQGLIGNGGQEVPPVTGTNASPAAWSSGCSGSSQGCYGYHSNEGVLSGGSTRFAANDTYAQFSTNPKEIAYNGTPVTAKITDIVYKVEAHSTQAAGSYDSSIVYIVTPVF